MGLADIHAAFHKQKQKDAEIADSTAKMWEFGGDVVSEPLKTALSNGFFRKNDEKRAKGLHPSQIYGMCYRAKMYDENFLDVMKGDPAIEGMAFEETISATLQAKFDIGHAIHHWYQNHYLGQMGILKGGWRCPHCDAVVEGFRPAYVCSCGCDRWRFVEPAILIPELGMVGHCDGIIDRGDGPWVMDIKTIDPDRFKALTEPSMGYIYQVHCYMIGLNIRRSIILYVDKSSNMANPTKEIKIFFNPAIEAEIYRIADDYKKMSAGKILVPASCQNKSCSQAKRCAFRNICFSDLSDRFEELWKGTKNEAV
jgi:hypothetical protein